MGSTQGIRAGRAFVELFADSTALVRGLKSAEGQLKAFGAKVRNIGLAVTAAGMAIAAPLAGGVKYFASTGSEMARMSQRTGASVEALSSLSFAARQSGISIEDVEVAIKRMQKAVYDAGHGTGETASALRALGLSAEQLSSMSADKQMEAIADALAKVKDPAERAALAMKVFGRNGTAVLPMLAGGAKGLQEMYKQAQRLGLTMSTADAMAARGFAQAMSHLSGVIQMGAFHIGASLAPALKLVADRMTEVAVSASKWIAANSQLAPIVAATVIAVTGFGDTLVAVGASVDLACHALDGMADAMKLAMAALRGGGAILVWMLSPIGLVTAAAAGLGSYLVYASGIGGKALAWLSDRFTSLSADAITSYKAIGNAMAAGDIGLAAKVLWLTIKMEWAKGTGALDDIWNAFSAGWQVAMADLSAQMQRIWTDMIAALQKAWLDFSTWYQKLINDSAMGEGPFGWILKKLGLDAESEGTKLAVQNGSMTPDEAKDPNNFVHQQVQGQHAQDQKNLDDRKRQQEDDLEAQRQKTIDLIGKANQDKLHQIGTDLAAKQQRNQQELDNATGAWQDAIKKANAESPKQPVAGPENLKNPQDILDDLDARIKSSTAGTFSGRDLGMMGMGTAMERTAKATEQTAANTKAMAKRQAPQVVFS